MNGPEREIAPGVAAGKEARLDSGVVLRIAPTTAWMGPPYCFERGERYKGP